MTLEELNLMLEPKLRNKVCLNQSQVSEILGVSPSTLANWRLKQGLGPEYKKVGTGKSRIIYSKSSILEWLNNTIKTA
ncbi:helix-turn-helix domain-containing protein [Halarcobacter sp.]|uniref:helix-turn-helix transcriptional regulator n=1 Tax=Halarcobacter sp. TaxID=2321133 RepID=UPI002AABFAF9|nr:helix-turn-helix domain-containing protein [Halarcobacter sp.]